MKVRTDRCYLPTLPATSNGDERFEAVRETLAEVVGGPHQGHDALRHAMVRCRTHEMVEGKVCEHCEHFLNALPSAMGRRVLVRCVLFETDTVDALMTRAADLVTVAREESAAVAAARMVDHDVNQLVVLDDSEVIGLVDARTVSSASGDLASCVSETFPVVPRTMSLGMAAGAFRAADLDVVGVVDGSELVGLLTRGDLRRAGVPGV